MGHAKVAVLLLVAAVCLSARACSGLDRDMPSAADIAEGAKWQVEPVGDLLIDFDDDDFDDDEEDDPEDLFADRLESSDAPSTASSSSELEEPDASAVEGWKLKDLTSSTSLLLTLDIFYIVFRFLLLSFPRAVVDVA